MKIQKELLPILSAMVMARIDPPRGHAGFTVRTETGFNQIPIPIGRLHISTAAGIRKQIEQAIDDHKDLPDGADASVQFSDLQSAFIVEVLLVVDWLIGIGPQLADYIVDLCLAFEVPTDEHVDLVEPNDSCFLTWKSRGEVKEPEPQKQNGEQ